MPDADQRQTDPIRNAALWVFSLGRPMVFVGVGLAAFSSYLPVFANTIGAPDMFREGTLLSFVTMGTFFVGAGLTAFGFISVVATGGE